MKQARANREEIKFGSEELTFSDFGGKASSDQQASSNEEQEQAQTPHLSTETRETMIVANDGKLNTEEEEKKETN